MLDEDFKVYLIEVNTNPALSTPCPLLARIIPSVLDASFRIAIDPMFPPPDFSASKKSNWMEMTENKFELIFDENIDGPDLRKVLENQEKVIFDINEEEEELEDAEE
jgi:hypothetical protein